MSSADSVILGVSNTVCVEYRNMINPDAEQSSVVRLGYGVSLVMAIVGAFLAMNINGSTFINWLGLQNGIILQLLPAVLLGLYTNTPPRAIGAGMFIGLALVGPLLYVQLFGDPTIAGLLQYYLAGPSLAGVINFLVVFLMRCCSSDESTTPYTETLEKRFNDGANRLQLADVEKFMQGHSEPNRRLMAMALIILPFTVPFIQWEGTIGIMPVWAFFVAVMLVVDTFVIFLAALSWAPKSEDEKQEDLMGIEM